MNEEELDRVDDVVERLELENARLRAQLASEQPHPDGLEIVDKASLAEAIRALPRSRDPQAAKAFIRRRGAALGLIPGVARGGDSSSGQADVAVSVGVRRDLEKIREVAPELADSALAVGAMRTARAMDEPDLPAGQVAQCQRVLLETMDRLRELMPDQGKRSRLDELSARRAARRAHD